MSGLSPGYDWGDQGHAGLRFNLVTAEEDDTAIR